ncbi:hypothetical protein LOY90_006680, partial [Ophidiomyces ophidiicola]
AARNRRRTRSSTPTRATAIPATAAATSWPLTTTTSCRRAVAPSRRSTSRPGTGPTPT